MPNELTLAVQNFSEIPRTPVQILKIPWIDVFVDQYRQELVSVEQILSISFQISHINSVLIKDILNQPQVVQVSRDLSQKLPIKAFVEI